MSDQDKTIRSEGGGYHLCDMARSERNFSVAHVASGELVEVGTEQEARTLVEREYPGVRFVLTTGRHAIEGQDLGSYVVMVGVRPSPSGTETVALIAGCVRGPTCVPFSPGAWADVEVANLIQVDASRERCPLADLEASLIAGLESSESPNSPTPTEVAPSSPPPVYASLREASVSWTPQESPHPYREKPPGVEWPLGPRGETCADCGRDPRNRLHRV